MAFVLNGGNARDDSSEDIAELRKRRRNRFRILVCIDGSDASYDGLRFAARIGKSAECDIILLFVRLIDQGLRTGGLQVRIARENMLDWGLELPGIRYLKRGLSILAGKDGLSEDWTMMASHSDSWGDPLGDNKVEYRHENGRSIVLKLKTAPDIASGILDQYELGPYNLIIMGEPGHWHSEARSFFGASVAQKVAMLAPCSVMVARPKKDGQQDAHLICVDGTRHSLEAMRREAVLAHHCGDRISVLCVARNGDELPTARRVLEKSGEMLKKIGISDVNMLARQGEPATEIVRAGSDHSVIAVADSGKKLFRRLFTGGIAFRVMGTADTSVINVR